MKRWLKTTGEIVLKAWTKGAGIPPGHVRLKLLTEETEDRPRSVRFEVMKFEDYKKIRGRIK